MPKIAEIEYTPNPHAVKFVLRQPVAIGFPKSFPNREVAQADELAKALFDVGSVTSVFMQDRILTVTKTPEATWGDLLPKLAVPIRSAPAAGGDPANTPEGERPQPTTPLYDPNDPFLERVRQVLSIQILPALAADGGGLEIVGRHEKQIMIRYMGACTSCPSGLTGTLVAIEGILKAEVDPDIIVIPV